MLIEQIIEFWFEGAWAPGRTYIPKTGYFHDETKIFKSKSLSALFNAKNIAESNVPRFSWLGPSHKI